MKKTLLLLSLILVAGCSNTTDKESLKVYTNINDINWNTYCKVKFYFAGVEDHKLKDACFFQIDNNYTIEESIYVRLTVKQKLFYYAGLLGEANNKGFIDYSFYYEGLVDAYSKELTPLYEYTYEGTKELFKEGNEEVIINDIRGKLSKSL